MAYIKLFPCHFVEICLQLYIKVDHRIKNSADPSLQSASHYTLKKYKDLRRPKRFLEVKDLYKCEILSRVITEARVMTSGQTCPIINHLM